jgi:hypothetical protein
MRFALILHLDVSFGGKVLNHNAAIVNREDHEVGHGVLATLVGADQPAVVFRLLRAQVVPSVRFERHRLPYNRESFHGSGSLSLEVTVVVDRGELGVESHHLLSFEDVLGVTVLTLIFEDELVIHTVKAPKFAFNQCFIWTRKCLLRFGLPAQPLDPTTWEESVSGVKLLIVLAEDKDFLFVLDGPWVQLQILLRALRAGLRTATVVIVIALLEFDTEIFDLSVSEDKVVFVVFGDFPITVGVQLWFFGLRWLLDLLFFLVRITAATATAALA